MTIFDYFIIGLFAFDLLAVIICVAVSIWFMIEDIIDMMRY